MAIINENDETLTVDRRYTDWIPPKKVKHFKTLFKIVASRVGGCGKAKEIIGLSNNNYGLMNKNRLSGPTAKKIYAAYEKHCKA